MKNILTIIILSAIILSESMAVENICAHINKESEKLIYVNENCYAINENDELLIIGSSGITVSYKTGVIPGPVCFTNPTDKEKSKEDKICKSIFKKQNTIQNVLVAPLTNVIGTVFSLGTNLRNGVAYAVNFDNEKFQEVIEKNLLESYRDKLIKTKQEEDKLRSEYPYYASAESFLNVDYSNYNLNDLMEESSKKENEYRTLKIRDQKERQEREAKSKKERQEREAKSKKERQEREAKVRKARQAKEAKAKKERDKHNKICKDIENNIEKASGTRMIELYNELEKQKCN